jgi:hypothetical protein
MDICPSVQEEFRDGVIRLHSFFLLRLDLLHLHIELIQLVVDC